jgi:hypothetical protein
VLRLGLGRVQVYDESRSDGSDFLRSFKEPQGDASYLWTWSLNSCGTGSDGSTSDGSSSDDSSFDGSGSGPGIQDFKTLTFF